MENMVNKFGEGVFAVVMDSYDYEAALNVLLPRLKELKEKKGA